MTKAIILDFWGTLVENGVWSPTKQVRRILRVNMPFSEYVMKMEKALMTQKFETLSDAFKNVCTAFEQDCSQEKIERLIGMWNKNWMLAKPYDQTVQVLKDLQQDYKLILIANTDATSVNNVLDKFGLRELFDAIYLSCDTALLKTDKELLEKALTENKLSAKECVLVGDSIQSDMKAGSQARIRSILIDRRNSRDYPDKIQTLGELKGALDNE